ncbi:MAG: hypothetical protein CMJ90_04215 [Planctomycetes bacterium]|nr:hypothetical protein [Planctomycetota bacterium]
MEEAERLKREWDRRGRSPLLDLYIASHTGWDDPETWGLRAARDVDFILTDIGADQLRRAHVCEVGCGVGRLVPALAPRVASYTGVDIAPSIVSEARRRCEGLDDVRFFEGDGAGLPDVARDREYDLIFAVAVFIHCPRAVVESNLRSMKAVLAPSGQVRYQLRALLADPEGIAVPEEFVKATDAEQASTEVDFKAIVQDAGEEDLIGDGYMGHKFTYREASEMTRAVFGSDAAVLRLDRQFIIGGWTRGAP